MSRIVKFFFTAVSAKRTRNAIVASLCWAVVLGVLGRSFHIHGPHECHSGVAQVPVEGHCHHVRMAAAGCHSENSTNVRKTILSTLDDEQELGSCAICAMATQVKLVDTPVAETAIAPDLSPIQLHVRLSTLSRLWVSLGQSARGPPSILV